MLKRQPRALCLISPPNVSANNILLCSTVGPPLLLAEECKQPALRDLSNSFCSELLAVQRMSGNGWKGRNYWKYGYCKSLKIKFHLHYKKSKTLKIQGCSLLKHNSLHKNFPDYWEFFPDYAEACTTQLSLVNTQHTRYPSSKVSLILTAL